MAYDHIPSVDPATGLFYSAVQNVQDNRSTFFANNAISQAGLVLTLSETAVSTTTTLSSAYLGKMIACTATAAAFTLTLPTAASYAGYQIGVRITPSSTKLVTLASSGGTFEGLSTRVMWAGESATLESDGTNWIKIAGKTRPMTCQYQDITAIAIATASQTTITFDTISRDNTGLMASSSRIYINRPGLYSVKARIGLANAPANSIRCITTVYKNLATTVIQQEVNAVTGTYLTFVASDDIALIAGDFLQLQFYHAAGVNWSTYGVTGSSNSAMTVTEIPDW